MSWFEGLSSPVARGALAAIFIHSGWGKLTALANTVAALESKGLPAPTLFALLAGVTELAGGLMLVFGWRARLAAGALALFLLPATVLFHNPIGLASAEAHMQQIHAYKNLAIAGGLLAIVTWGAGALALDARPLPERAGGHATA